MDITDVCITDVMIDLNRMDMGRCARFLRPYAADKTRIRPRVTAPDSIKIGVTQANQAI